MNTILGRLPLLLEIVINGFFVAFYTFHKSKKIPDFLQFLPKEKILEHAIWVVPLVLFITLLTNFLKSESFDEFIRKYVFSVIIFVPVMITWGDIEFVYWLSAVHLFSTFISIYEKQERKKRKQTKLSFSPNGENFLLNLKLQPAQVIMLSFLGVILIGTFILLLPISTTGGKGLSFIDALFMSTSATCVTGLSTISVGKDLSVFGQMVLMILVQIGGLGIMTLSSSMAVIMGRNLQLREKVIMQNVLDTSSSEELMNLVSDIVKFTLTIEFIGALLLTIGFYQAGFEIGQSIYYGFFHSVAAFCNAGFALWDNSLTDFKFDPLIEGTVMGLITLGGLGFSVIKDLLETIKNRRSLRTLMLHTKIVVVIHFSLVALGAIYFFFGEYLNAFEDFTFFEKIQAAIFQSVTIRTAGFFSVDFSLMQPHCIYLAMLFMFIGASPGSTGGGVKTTTFAILLQSVTSTLKGKQYVEFFERRIPSSTVVKSIAIFTISLIVVSVGVLVMVRLEPDKGFFPVLFEVVSAFATAGLSLNVTTYLSDLGKICILSMMYLGRIGPLTLVLAVGSRVMGKANVEYPEGKVLIG